MSVRQVSMLVAALLVGVLLGVQWPSGPIRPVDASDPVMQTIRQLELEQGELKRRVGLLREELDARQQAMGSSTELLEDLNRELAAQKALAGLADLQGPGIEILLDDSRRSFAGNASDLLIHDFDLRDVVNLLWIAGAEAISVNGERIVNNSSIYCVGSTVLVNDTRLSPPYQVKALGDPQRLLDTIQNPGYLDELKMRQVRVGVRFEPVLSETVFVPAYRGSLPLKYAKPGS